MPKLIHKLPKYSLHKASGQARVKYAGKVTCTWALRLARVAPAI